MTTTTKIGLACVCAALVAAGPTARAQGKPSETRSAPPSGAQGQTQQDNESAQRAATQRELEAMRRGQQQLLKRLEQLEQHNQEQELKLLKMGAEAEAATGGEVVKQADEQTKLEEKVFRGGQRALQALNPELSVVGDALGVGIFDDDGYAAEGDRSGFVFRMIGVHLQSDLDPFTFTKITVGVTPGGVSLGEAYMTWTSLLPGVSLTLGKFRQELGVVNRWHLPGLDQYDWPLAMREILGTAGLSQIGISIDWLMPRLWAHTNHLVLQVTNGQNGRLFAGDFYSVPAVLLRLKSYYDLTEATYFELGLTGMLGWNNARGKADDAGELQNEPWRATWVWGADWSLVWEPLQRAKYRNLVLRGELYGARKELPGDQSVLAVGLYQYVEGKLSRSIVLGARFDWTMPFQTDNDDQYILGVQPYVTWWQSPWVRLRLAYAYTYDKTAAATRRYDHRMVLQATFAAGPHKHERY